MEFKDKFTRQWAEGGTSVLSHGQNVLSYTYYGLRGDLREGSGSHSAERLKESEQ